MANQNATGIIWNAFYFILKNNLILWHMLNYWKLQYVTFFGKFSFWPMIGRNCQISQLSYMATYNYYLRTINSGQNDSNGEIRKTAYIDFDISISNIFMRSFFGQAAYCRLLSCLWIERILLTSKNIDITKLEDGRRLAGDWKLRGKRVVTVKVAMVVSMMKTFKMIS